MLKLFQLIPADFACFGQKDYQQLQVIRRMVRGSSLPIEIVAVPDHSRAGWSGDEQPQPLSFARRAPAGPGPVAGLGIEPSSSFAAGERDAAAIVAEMQGDSDDAGIHRIDYVALADPETLAEKKTIDGPAIALIAAYVGRHATHRQSSIATTVIEHRDHRSRL